MNYKKKLKAALKAKGLSEELADFIDVTSEKQIEEVVKSLASTQDNDEIDFSKVLASKEFGEFVEKNGLEKVLETSKTLQSEFDKKVTKGIKTFKQKFVKDELDEDEKDDDTKKSGEGDVPAWAKKLIEKVDDFEKNTKTSKTLEQAKELFSKSKSLSRLPEKIQQRYLKSIDLDGESSLDDQIKEFEEEAGELKITGGAKNPGLPMGGTVDDDTKATDEEVEDIVGGLM